MVLVITHVPELPAEQDAEFRAWFAWSNDRLRHVDGLTGRRLMLALDGTYVVLLEHTSAETFAAMQGTEAASEVHARLRAILPELLRPTVCEVVMEMASS